MSNQKMLLIAAAGAAALYIFMQHRSATTLDRRYPMAYR